MQGEGRSGCRGKQQRMNQDGGWHVIFGEMRKGRIMIEVSSCVRVAVQENFHLFQTLKFRIWNSNFITRRHTCSPLCSRLGPLEDTLVSKGSSRIPSQNNIVCLHCNKSDLLHVTSLFLSFFCSPCFFFLLVSCLQSETKCFSFLRLFLVWSSSYLKCSASISDIVNATLGPNVTLCVCSLYQTHTLMPKVSSCLALFLFSLLDFRGFLPASGLTSAFVSFIPFLTTDFIQRFRSSLQLCEVQFHFLRQVSEVASQC